LYCPNPLTDKNIHLDHFVTTFKIKRLP